MENPVKKNNSYCSVPQCRSKGAGVSFHRFPDEKSTVTIMRLGQRESINRRNEWVRALKIAKNVTKRMSVCSLHFQKSDYLYPDMPRIRKRLKRTAVPSLNLPVSSTQKVGILRKKENNARDGQGWYENQSTERYSQKKKVWLSDKQSSLYDDLLDKANKISLISPCSQGSAILTGLETILKTPAVALNEPSRKVPERIFTPSGCASILAYNYPPEPNKNSLQASVGLPSESTAFRADIKAPEECAFQNVGDNDCVQSNSRKTLIKQLNTLWQKIDDLKLYANQLELKHMRLAWEQQSSLVKNVHTIKQNAVDGDLEAIILLNNIVSYNTTPHT